MPDGGGGTAGSNSGGNSGNEAGGVNNGGAGPGADCTVNQECSQGVCFRGICGGILELSYADTPDTGSDPKAAKWIKFRINIQNRTTQTYPLSAIKVRYYYTPEDVTSELQVLSTTSLPESSDDITGTFGVANGWTYLELGFTGTAGSLKSGQATGNIKLGIHDMDFGPGTFYQPGDYSYLEPTHLTLEVDSQLVFGIPPSAPPG